MPDIALLKSSAYSALQGLINAGDDSEASARTAGDNARTAAIRDAGILPLTNIGGTGDAITAELQTSMTNAGITSLSGTSEVEYIPAATNSAANPTLTIAGTTYGIRNADGGTWAAGAFVVGRSYKLRRRNTSLRVSGGDVSGSELSAMQYAAGIVDLTNIGGTGDAITASLPTGSAYGYIAAPAAFRFVPIAANTAINPTITIGSAVRTLRGVGNAPMSIGSLIPGRSYIFRVTGATQAELLAFPVSVSEGASIQEQASWYAARASRERNTGVLNLVNIGGTGDAITAEFYEGAAAVSLQVPAVVRLVPATTNLTDGPYLTIGGSTRRLRDTTNSLLPAGALIPDRTYLFYVYGQNDAQLVAFPSSLSEVPKDTGSRLGASEAGISSLREAFGRDVSVVVQRAATLPPRPPRRIVYWQTWTDPSAAMQEPDVWLPLPVPAAPGAVPAAAWDLMPTRVSGQIAIRINEIPNLVPEVTQFRYRVNAGSWVNISGVSRGYTIISGLADGISYSVEVQQQNYIGWGPSSPPKSATPGVAANVSDSFSRADGILLSSAPEWDVSAAGARLAHVSNTVRNNSFGMGSADYGGVSVTGIAIHRGYFTDAQWAEVTFTGVGANQSFGPGILLQADTALILGGQGYLLTVKPSYVLVRKNIDGAWVQQAQVFFTASPAAPQVLRAEYDGAGTIAIKDVTAGTTIATWTDLSGTPLPTWGRPGIQSSYPSGQEVSGQIDNFMAGNL